jgi:hypothetical protein
VFRHINSDSQYLLAGKLAEAQMNQIFGWKQSSEMLSIYVHLSGKDVDDAILAFIDFRSKATNAYDIRF